MSTQFAGDIALEALLRITIPDDSGLAAVGDIILGQVTTWPDAQEGSKATVSGPRGVIGITKTHGGYTISLSEQQAANAPNQVPWEEIEEGDIFIEMTSQVIGGETRKFSRGQVSTTASENSDGTITKSIELIFIVRDVIQRAA